MLAQFGAPNGRTMETQTPMIQGAVLPDVISIRLTHLTWFTQISVYSLESGSRLHVSRDHDHWNIP